MVTYGKVTPWKYGRGARANAITPVVEKSKMQYTNDITFHSAHAVQCASLKSKNLIVLLL